MSQSLSLLYVHIVFHIGNPLVRIHSLDAGTLYYYIGNILKKYNSLPVCIGGMPDHIHILCVLSKNISLADLVREVKRSSAIWLKEKSPDYTNFSWQGGYGAFSVGVSSYKKTITYIENQMAHHKKKTFQEEYVDFLKESGIIYNEKYLWDD